MHRPSRLRCISQTESGGGSCQPCRPDEMSLLDVCRTCGGKCCVGRTLVLGTERERIIQFTRLDAMHYWADDVYFLERGACPYLKEGRCSVQDVKPLICRIFPFVPRVVAGEFWLFCVGECDAAHCLPAGFVEQARKLARAFFLGRDPLQYGRYWDENKLGDFDDARVVMRVRVFDAPPHEVSA
ncbi:Flagellin N-methylase [Phycisphaerae bacterium RAS1]|nr:Flagellin N-methylase [Phycisphaerae bacterium RAS1]